MGVMTFVWLYDLWKRRYKQLREVRIKKVTGRTVKKGRRNEQKRCQCWSFQEDMGTNL